MKTNNKKMVRTTKALDTQMLAGYRQTGKHFGLFDELDAATKKRIRDLKIDSTELCVGMDLDGDGFEIIETIQTVFHLHSQTTDQYAPNYYKGDKNDTDTQVASWNGEAKPVAYIKTNLAELTKIRTGIERPHGREIETTAKLIAKYNKKAFFVRYKENYTETKIIKGKETNRKSYRTIETADALFWAIVKRDKGTRCSCVQLWLLPLFFHQIATNYNCRPIDYISRVRRTYNKLSGKSINTKTPKGLHYFLSRLIEAQTHKKRMYNCRLYGDGGLYDMIDERATARRMHKQQETTLQLFADVAIEIGLLEKWETKPSADNKNTIAIFFVVKQGQWQ